MQPLYCTYFSNKVLKMETKSIIINEKSLQYVGLPLTAVIFDGQYWGGRSNFLGSDEREKTNISLENIEDCFQWMKRWSNGGDYLYGYVLDYSTKIIYYDKQEALDYILKKVFPKLKEENFFERFVQIDFSVKHRPYHSSR